jgi:hypothetical protein
MNRNDTLEWFTRSLEWKMWVQGVESEVSGLLLCQLFKWIEMSRQCLRCVAVN